MIADIVILPSACGESPIQVPLKTSIFANGIGLTLKVKLLFGPKHPLKAALTVIVPVSENPELFIAINEGIFPEPFAAKPILVLLFTQLKLEPGIVPVNVIGEVFEPEQIIWLAGIMTSGVGLIKIANVCGRAMQPLETGVTVILAEIIVELLFVVINDGILPEPFAANPILLLSFVQL